MLLNNKTGSISTNLLVIMTFILVSTSLLAFYTSSKEVKTELIDSYFLNKIYNDEFRIEENITNIIEQEIIYNYATALNEKDEIKSRNNIINSVDEKIKAYSWKNYNISFENDEFYFNGELNEPMVGCLNKEKMWAWGVIENNCKLSVIYRPKIDSKVNVFGLGLEAFRDYFDSIKICKGEADVKKCFENKLKNFNVNYDEDKKILSLESKQYYMISGELKRIELKIDLT